MPGMLDWRPPTLPDLFDRFETGLAGFPALRGVAGAHGIRIEEQVTDQGYCLRAELPGLDADKDIRIDIARGALSLHAERGEETRTPRHSEFHYGTFARSVRLPQGTQDDQATAEYKDGILTVAVPIVGAEKAAVKRIEVRRAE
ncbi:Hsp20/alpha crystallin family protein [Streptomyces sp. NPDC047461]|uniref:Hsp20/alpha crystallin family protein n=1 Tax=Streptomyces sp. NPDC047461 TaxID=3155619 RepID=UPI003411CB1A